MVVGRTATNAPVSQLHYIACRDACWWATNAGPNTRIVVDNSLITTCNDGPAVSLNGSPTVSPVTAALCASLFLPPKLPSSMNFLALSCEGSAAAACQHGLFAPPSKCDWQRCPQPRALAHTQPLSRPTYPRATNVVKEQRHEDAGHCGHHQEGAQHFRTQQRPVGEVANDPEHHAHRHRHADSQGTW